MDNRNVYIALIAVALVIAVSGCIQGSIVNNSNAIILNQCTNQGLTVTCSGTDTFSSGNPAYVVANVDIYFIGLSYNRPFFRTVYYNYIVSKYGITAQMNAQQTGNGIFLTTTDPAQIQKLAAAGFNQICSQRWVYPDEYCHGGSQPCSQYVGLPQCCGATRYLENYNCEYSKVWTQAEFNEIMNNSYCTVNGDMDIPPRQIGAHGIVPVSKQGVIKGQNEMYCELVLTQSDGTFTGSATYNLLATPPAPQPYCGDGNCDVNEDQYSCSADCGSPTTPYCGDGNCDAASEDYNSCPSDCPAPQTLFDKIFGPIVQFIEDLINRIKGMLGW